MRSKLTQAEINERLTVKGFEYVEGYISPNCKMVIKCKKCGFKFENAALHNKKIECLQCKDQAQNTIMRDKPKEIHKRNNILINRFPSNWYALAICICSNKSIEKALINMNIKDRKTPERKTDVKLPRHDWAVLDVKVEEMLNKGLKITEISEATGISKSTIKTRLRKLRGLSHA